MVYCSDQRPGHALDKRNLEEQLELMGFDVTIVRCDDEPGAEKVTDMTFNSLTGLLLILLILQEVLGTLKEFANHDENLSKCRAELDEFNQRMDSECKMQGGTR